MAERLILTLVNSFALLMILIMQIITPKATRKTILFGVKVPTDAIYYKEVQKLYEEYEKTSKIIGGIALIILSILVYYFYNIKFQLLSIFLYIGILFLIYLRTNLKAEKLKREKNWDTLDSLCAIIGRPKVRPYKCGQSNTVGLALLAR